VIIKKYIYHCVLPLNLFVPDENDLVPFLKLEGQILSPDEVKVLLNVASRSNKAPKIPTKKFFHVHNWNILDKYNGSKNWNE
jgi:hypothetical protein